MFLRQTLEKPVNGYWDGGARQTFDWYIVGTPHTDSKGKFVKIGSFCANHFFHVALGKTDKLTLSYAKKRLESSTKLKSTFEYIKEKGDR